MKNPFSGTAEAVQHRQWWYVRCGNRIVASEHLSEEEAAFLVRAINQHGKLVAALPDPVKLETLALWFDAIQDRIPEWVDIDVQEDLRRWAAQAREALLAEEVKL